LQFFFASAPSPIASAVLADVKTSPNRAMLRKQRKGSSRDAPYEADFFGSACGALRLYTPSNF